MLIAHPHLALRLHDYGIQVPLEDSRDLKTFQHLKNIVGDKITETPLEQFPVLSREDFLRVHSREFVEDLFVGGDRLKKQLIKTYQLDDPEGLEFKPEQAQKDLSELFQTLLLHGRGTLLALKTCLKNSERFSYFLGGGLHHAMSFGGRGFCLFHDGLIALEQLKSRGDINSAWIIDIDAHKGDGTAELCQKRDWVKTLSLHMKKGWPLDQRKKDSPKAPWYIPSDIDLEIDEAQEDDYLDSLQNGLHDMAQRFDTPDVVWVVAGADPYEADQLASTALLKLSKEQLLQRDQLVYEFFKKQEISQSWAMAGGYGPQSWEIYAQFLEWIFLIQKTRGEEPAF